jgi:hypothetical protein
MQGFDGYLCDVTIGVSGVRIGKRRRSHMSSRVVAMETLNPIGLTAGRVR